MIEDRFQNSVLIQNFQKFYTELLRLKAWALNVTGIPDNIKIKEEASQLSKAQKIKNTLMDLIDFQYQGVENKSGGYAAQYYREAQYAMVGLADEIFLTLNWDGQKEWEDNLLESAVFGTQDAGQKIFENMDTYLKTQDGSNLDIGVIYLLILGLGFQGQYRGQEKQDALRAYGIDLYQAIINNDSDQMGESLRYFPQAYDNIVTAHVSVIPPNPRNWYIALGGTFLIFLLISFFLWHLKIYNLMPLINDLQRYDVYK